VSVAADGSGSLGEAVLVRSLYAVVEGGSAHQVRWKVATTSLVLASSVGPPLTRRYGLVTADCC